MDKHYRKALIEATMDALRHDEHIENPDRVRLERLNDNYDWPYEDFYDQIEDLKAMYLMSLEQEENEATEEDDEIYSESDHPDTPEESIEKVVESLHVGFNFVPGIGVGYCKDQEDLDKMKEFVRGGLAVQELVKAFYEGLL